MERKMEDKSFNYVYSAQQQEEIKAIRNKYCEPQEDKMELLRRLDASVTSKATMLSLIVGILGALIFGSGLSLLLSDISVVIGMGRVASTVIGILLGVVGLVPVCAAYPLYNKTLAKERARVAPEIIRLTDELIK